MTPTDPHASYQDVDPAYASAHRFRVVPASYVFLLRAGEDGRVEVLLQLRRGTGYMDEHWAAGAAGHVEAGESAVAAALREVSEELGVAVPERYLEPLTAMHRTAGDGQQVNERVDFFFAAERWSGEPRLVETAKAAALEWVALADLGTQAFPGPVVPHELAVLAGLRDGVLPPVLTFGFSDAAASEPAGGAPVAGEPAEPTEPR